jgi:hypothetical protein
MSSPIFSGEAAVPGVSFLPPRQEPSGHCTLKPGERSIDGRVFYSAAWLGHADSAIGEPPRLRSGQVAGRTVDPGNEPAQGGSNPGSLG